MANMVAAVARERENLLEENRRANEVVHLQPEDEVSCRICLMRVNIITIGNIDTIKEQFTCEFVLTVKWKEPDIGGKKADEIDWGKVWEPRIHFFNAVKIDKRKPQEKRLAKESERDRQEPIVQLSIWIKGVFNSTMKLNQFPFDYQNLTIRVTSDWPRGYIDLIKDMSQNDEVRTGALTDEREWELQNHVHVYPENETMCSANTYPTYIIVVNVKRKASYYMWNVVLIMFLITHLAFASYAVSSDTPQARMGVTLTLLLTAAAYKSVVAKCLPKISYQTLLDYYVLWSMTFLCLVVIQNAVASLFPTDKVWEQFDLPTLCVLGGLTFAINLAFIVIARWSFYKVGHQIKEDTQAYNDLCKMIEDNWGRAGQVAYKSPMNEMSIQEERAPLSNPDPPRERSRYEKV